jgi:hypothetical protein
MPQVKIGSKTYTVAAGTTPEELAALIAAEQDREQASEPTSPDVARKTPEYNDVEARVWKFLGASPEKIAEWKARKEVSVADLRKKEAGGSWPYELTTANKMPDLTPVKGQEEPGLAEKAIGAIDPVLAALAPFAGVNPLTGKKIEAKQEAPGARRRPSTPPTTFSVDELSKLDEATRSKALDAASDSELRYAMHTAKAKDAELRAQMGKPRNIDAIHEEASRGFMDAAISKAKLDKLVEKATPDQLDAARKQAQSIAQARRAQGFPWKQAYDKAFAEALRVGAASADEAFAKAQGPYGGKAPDSMDLSIALDAIKNETDPTRTQARETPAAFTQKFKEVSQARNQKEVDAAHERMLIEQMSGPEMSMLDTGDVAAWKQGLKDGGKGPRMIVEDPLYREGAGARENAPDPAVEAKKPWGAIDPVTGDLIGKESRLRVPRRQYKDPLSEVVARRFMAKPNQEPEVKPQGMTRAEWERKKAERERKNKS